MARPYARHGMTELESLFEDCRGDSKILKELAAELKCRSTNRAADLLSQVQSALAKGFTAGVALQLQPELDLGQWRLEPQQSQPISRPEASRKPPAPTEPKLEARVASAQEQRPTIQLTPKVDPVLRAISLSDATRVLGIKADSTWEQVEQARCKLVNASSPEATVNLASEEKVARLQIAKEANDAYEAMAVLRAY